MKWIKLGRVYAPSGKYGWDKTHAYIPTPYIMEDRIRVFVAFWDENKVGRLGYVDVDKENPLKVLAVSKNPVLDIGMPGTFDDNGVTPISIVKRNSSIYLYYVGWQLGVKVRYYLFSGVAISNDNGEHFERVSKAPILDRSDKELFVRTAPYVLYDEGIYKMWYLAGSEWIHIDGKAVPRYNMRYLESKNGIDWASSGKVCMNLRENEIGFGRPYVIKEKNLYKMWYSIRTIHNKYYIGYAESKDGINWVRMDEDVGISVSSSGWDSEMICFPAIVDIKDKRYMFYNGNNFGETGFGVAVLENEEF